MRILGIDPALNNVGYGIIVAENGLLDVIEYGIYDIRANFCPEQKMLVSYEITRNLIRTRNIDEMALEIAYHNPKRAKGGAVVREVIGILRLAAFQEGVGVRFYTPQTAKKVIAGKGNADKLVVAQEVARLLKNKEFEITKNGKHVILGPEKLVAQKLDHVADALAIAICSARAHGTVKEVGRNVSPQKE